MRIDEVMVDFVVRLKCEPMTSLDDANAGVFKMCPITFDLIKSDSNSVGNDNDRCLSVIA